MLVKLPDEWHQLLHTLWSQATGCPGYVKADWMKLEGIVFECCEAVTLLASSRPAEGNLVAIKKLPGGWFDLLHRLWTKASPGPNYVKADWMRLEQVLFEGALAMAKLERR